jgi:RNA polymerase sigma-70 factor, ECF subfamily
MSADEPFHANVLKPPETRDDAPKEACSADGLLVERLRRGDAEAGYRFFRDHYPSVYRYLFWLTERSEQAEDLAQETFVRAWRHLDRFDPCGSLRAWLHRIAHREFLRSVRRQTPTSLEVVGEVVAPEATMFTEAVELRQILRKLPAEQSEVVLLHDLEGYSSSEIASIVGAPASTVRRRLAQARERLRQELGEDDLTYVNEPAAPMRQWAWLPLDQMHALETRLIARATGDRAAPGEGARQEEAMERREFLRHAAAGAMGLMLPEAEKDVIDSRLTQKVTLAFKGVALSDVCERLRAETDVHLAAGPSVADEKVTLFCKQTPLRDVMRQLSRPFGYTWVRSTRNGQYRYELMQDLRSQLLEEELRNRDRNATLIALEREIERYRPYLALSPDEALARAKTAPPAEKPLLEKLASYGWGPVNLYYQLSRSELEALRAGQTLKYASRPLHGEQPLSPSVARGVLQSQREPRLKVFKWDPPLDGRDEMIAHTDANDPEGRPLTTMPGVTATVSLTLEQSELGRFTLNGTSGYYANRRPGRRPADTYAWGDANPLAVGTSPAVLKPTNGAANPMLAQDPTLRTRVILRPQPTCGLTKVVGTGDDSPPEPKVTIADVLEALHQATGLPVVSDHYTRLYKAETVSVSNQPLYDALNHLTDMMRLRWNKDHAGNWLQFRSTSYYNDRIKEVPNRLLARWEASRRQHGALTLDDLCEIVQLPDAQLDGEEMAEGARELYGLAEWDLGRNGNLRPHLKYLAGFAPAQRQEVRSPTGLPLTKMPLAQQQEFIARALIPEAGPLQSLDELEGAVLRVDYSLPGWFQWRAPIPASHVPWVMPVAPGRRGPRAPVRERTREATLAAAQRIFPQIRQAMLHLERRAKPEATEAEIAPQASQITPTRLELTVLYVPGASHARCITWTSTSGRSWHATWE